MSSLLSGLLPSFAYFTLLCDMAGSISKVLVLGHSFVKILENVFHKNFDRRASRTFGLVGTAEVYLQGTSGRTVGKLNSYDLHLL